MVIASPATPPTAGEPSAAGTVAAGAPAITGAPTDNVSSSGMLTRTVWPADAAGAASTAAAAAAVAPGSGAVAVVAGASASSLPLASVIGPLTRIVSASTSPASSGCWAALTWARAKAMIG